MTVEVRPVGLRCNLSCTYCYQHVQRIPGTRPSAFDLETVKKRIDSLGQPFVLYGGEPLMTAYRDLEHLMSWGYGRFGSIGIQTNGTLITDDHISLFLRCRAAVGISIDGPGPLNDARWAGSLDKTRELTKETEQTVGRLLAAGVRTALILTLHRLNASRRNLPVLCQWIRNLDGMGISRIRLHVLESATAATRRSLALTSEENLEAFSRLLRLEPSLQHMRFDLFADMEALLTGDDSNAPCVWRACDPLTTPGCVVVEPDGSITNCGSTNRDGVNFIKSSVEGFERYVALYHTAMEDGGCSGCRFFVMCKGYCPGTAIDDDWRNRTEHCALYKQLFTILEERMLKSGRKPLSLDPNLYCIEQLMIKEWQRGANPLLANTLSKVRDVGSESRQQRRYHSTVHSALCPGQPRRHSSFEARLHFPPRLFTRRIWVSEEARLCWQRPFCQLQAATDRLGWESVSVGLRRCHVTVLGDRSANELASTLSLSGLVIAPIVVGAGFALWILRLDSSLLRLPFTACYVIARPDDAVSMLEACQHHDTESIRSLLGFPECCAAFQENTFTRAKLSDATWSMVLSGSTKNHDDPNRLVIEDRSNCSTLLKPMGITPVFHQPCGFYCQESTKIAEALRTLSRSLGLIEEADWLEEILGWPAEWSALHGVAETKTPVFKTIGATDSTSVKRSIRYLGDLYPEKGAVGNCFPYKRSDEFVNEGEGEGVRLDILVFEPE